jgi:predicted DNA-binding transcriptional regulator AlpA
MRETGLEMLSSKDVAKLLGMTTKTVRRLAERGLFPRPLRINHRLLRWRLADVRRWMAEGLRGESA